jgi:hypothetical protein
MARPKRYPESVLNDKSRHLLSLPSYDVEQLIGRCRLQPWWRYLTGVQKETADGGTLAQRRRLLGALKSVELSDLASELSRSLSTDEARASLRRTSDLRGHGSLGSSLSQGYAPSVAVHPMADDDNRKLATWILAHQEEVLAMISVGSPKTSGVQAKGRAVPSVDKPVIPLIVLDNLSGKHRANQRASGVTRMGLHWVERVVGPVNWRQILTEARVATRLERQGS